MLRSAVLICSFGVAFLAGVSIEAYMFEQDLPQCHDTLSLMTDTMKECMTRLSQTERVVNACIEHAEERSIELEVCTMQLTQCVGVK